MEPDPTSSLESLVDTLAPNSRVLGLDLGSKRIGLALSDVSRTVATPMKTLKRAKFAQNAKELLDVAEEHEIGAFIIGLPFNLDGSEGPAAQSARAFVRNLAAKTDIPIALWDERLSTAAVERTLLDADTSRKRRAEVIDKMAAAYILQGALDRLNTI